MSVSFPIDENAFEALMCDIDAELTQAGASIPQRPMRALGVVSERFGVALPLGKPFPNAPAELHRNAWISERIRNWYSDRYGDRIKVDFSLGKMAISLDGDIYLLSIPVCYGTVRFVIDREFGGAAKAVSGDSARCNVLELVAGLTPARIKALPDDELLSVFDQFRSGFQAFSIFDGSRRLDPLIPLAAGDVASATNALMDQGRRFGDSKWASLQSAEKILKAVIRMKGGSPKFTHDLSSLFVELDGLGVHINPQPFVNAIQCSPGIRYGASSCTEKDALVAHQSSLALLVELYAVGVGLKSSAG